MLHLFLLIAKKENKTPDILEREDAAIVDTE